MIISYDASISVEKTKMIVNNCYSYSSSSSSSSSYASSYSYCRCLLPNPLIVRPIPSFNLLPSITEGKVTVKLGTFYP